MRYENMLVSSIKSYVSYTVAGQVTLSAEGVVVMIQGVILGPGDYLPVNAARLMRLAAEQGVACTVRAFVQTDDPPGDTAPFPPLDV